MASQSLEPNTSGIIGTSVPTDSVAAAPAALPFATVVAVPIIASAVVASIGISWNNLSPKEQAAVSAAVTQFFVRDLGLKRSASLALALAKTGLQDVGNVLEKYLSPTERAALEKKVLRGLPDDGEDKRLVDDPDPTPKRNDLDEDESRDSGLAFRAVARFSDHRIYDNVVVGSAYVEIPNEPGELPRNAVVNRLVQTVSGHDLTHMISGLGLNGIGADRIGAPFPATGIEVRELYLGPQGKKQHNVNGLYIEVLNDGFYEAITDGNLVNFQRITDAMPDELRHHAEKAVRKMARTTGYNGSGIVPNPGSDHDTHLSQGKASGVIQIHTSPNTGRDITKADPKFITIAKSHFSDLMAHDPTLRKELSHNAKKLIEISAIRDRQLDAELYDEVLPTEEAIPPKLEIFLSPASTEAILKTTINALTEMIEVVMSDKPGHTPHGLIELRNFYQNLLENGTDGTPSLSSTAPDAPFG